MNSNKVIQVFEYETLRVEAKGFTNSHFDLLAAYIDKRQDQYFQLGYRSIRFTNYVGVIQVQDLVIEVLPKTGRVSDKEVWREVLIDMLKISGFLNVAATTNALLKLRKGSLLDLYYQIFINQCRQLLNEGLV
jgi:5-methylcytosine-specific restriction enzyme subunit McrC